MGSLYDTASSRIRQKPGGQQCDELPPIPDPLPRHLRVALGGRLATNRRNLHSGSGGPAAGICAVSLEDYIADTYIHTHHWFGTCRMGPPGTVSSCRVASVSLISNKERYWGDLSSDGNDTRLICQALGWVGERVLNTEYLSRPVPHSVVPAGSE